MGYTHYWKKPSALKPNEFSEFVKDVHRLIKSASVKVVLEYDDSDKPPIIGDNGIQFNGVDSEGHETFLFTPIGSGFDFCKTARKPYDLLVTATLIAAKHHFGSDITVTSDGGDEDWEEGRDLCERVLGYGRGLHFTDDHNAGLTGKLV